MEIIKILKSILTFFAAGLCEIAGGYFIWLWLRENQSNWYCFAGGILLVLYGFLPILQPGNFGKIYAAYGGVFVIMSLLWGWIVDKVKPDFYDIIGGAIVLFGVGIIMYWPRV